MPVKVQSILSPEAPTPPSPPAAEVEILEFLRAESDQAFTFSEILMGVHSILLSNKNKQFLAALVGVFLVSLAEAASNSYKMALETLVKRGLVKTSKYENQQYYWAASQPLQK